jgi:superfamily I DNA/RNA helicase
MVVGGSKATEPKCFRRFSQVVHYKKHLIKLYIPDLCAEAEIDKRLFAVVATAVYFHQASESEVRQFVRTRAEHTQLLGHDSLQKERFARLLRSWRMDRPSILFNDLLYERFRHFLQPATHTLEQGIPLTYTPEQQKLLVSRAEQKKVSGVAGSGKTYVLAKRAVNAHLRTRAPVLVLTYNITIKNYIHDRISEVREEFDWKAFYITYYHCFFVSQANRYELPYSFDDNHESLSSFNNEEFFESVAQRIQKFDAIFVDEVQDYRIEWLRILKRYFLRTDGEFVLFGDEKQNVYGRPLEGKLIRTNIRGPFTKLRQSHRLSSRLADLASRFQTEFFATRHDVDTIESIRQIGLFKPHVEYGRCEKATPQRLAAIIDGYVQRWGIHPDDVAILCSQNDRVRELDRIVRTEWRQGTTSCTETQEQYDLLSQSKSGPSLDLALGEIRRSCRYNFWAHDGKVKISTFHSFKGWECSNVFVILEDQSRLNPAVDDELIYTAFTRSRDRLVLIDLGSSRYEAFFRRELQ